MADKTVVFKISPDGSKVEIEADGFIGTGCSDFAKRTMDALGQVTEKRNKPEMFQQGGSGISVGH